jgi:hypothetical protein
MVGKRLKSKLNIKRKPLAGCPVEGLTPLNGCPYGLSSRGEVKHRDNILTDQIYVNKIK